MINDKNLLLSITMEDCTNTNNIERIDKYAKEVTYETIEAGILEHGFYEMNQDDQVEYFLNHSLMRLLNTTKWKRFTEESDYTTKEITLALYTALKRHYYLTTNEFPVH